MKKWSLTDAKAQFSHLVESARWHGPQIIQRRGKTVAVLVSWKTYEVMNGTFHYVMKQAKAAEAAEREMTGQSDQLTASATSDIAEAKQD